MYVGFGKFLAGLAVVGVALGFVFGAGVAMGRVNRPATVVANTTSTGAGAAASAGSGGGATSGAAGQFGAARNGAVAGQVTSLTPNSMVVTQANGQAVTLTLNAETAVRKTDAGALSDVHTGDEVLVMSDASSVATTVQVVPAGTTFGRGGGATGSAGAGATRTPGAGGAARGTATPTP